MVDPAHLTLIIIGGFILLLASGVSIAFIMGGLASILVLGLWGPNQFGIIILRVWEQMTSYTFLAAPMFIFMAGMLKRSGIVEELYDTIHIWMGGLRGGLALATVIVCTIIAAMVGVIGAGIALMGAIALPEMLRRGYNKHLAAGTICASGSLGILIPPSIMFIVYSMIAGVSVGELFAGGMGAGLLLATLYFTYIAIRCFLRPEDGPAASLEVRNISYAERFRRAKFLVLPSVLVLAVIGSIFMGIATPTEAAGVGAAGAMGIAALRGRLNFRSINDVSTETIKVSAMIMWIIFGATTLVTIYNFAGGARYLNGLIDAMPLVEWQFFVVIMLFLFVLGFFLDWIGVLMLVGPFVIPLMANMGFDPLWFGVVFAMNMQMALLTPPFGPALFYLKGVAPPSITMGDLYRSALPFIAMQFVAIILVVIFPEIITWLPNALFR